MAMIIFFAFIVIYALLVICHRNRNARAYKLFSFGLLISILYASVYSIYYDTFLLFFPALTTLAIITQYLHIRAVENGKVKPMKMIVDVAKHTRVESLAAQKGQVGSRSAARSSRTSRSSRRRR